MPSVVSPIRSPWFPVQQTFAAICLHSDFVYHVCRDCSVRFAAGKSHFVEMPPWHSGEWPRARTPFFLQAILVIWVHAECYRAGVICTLLALQLGDPLDAG